MKGGGWFNITYNDSHRYNQNAIKLYDEFTLSKQNLSKCADPNVTYSTLAMYIISPIGAINSS